MLLNLMFIASFLIGKLLMFSKIYKLNIKGLNAQEKDSYKDFRQALNVNKFSSPEYPAMFGIIAGVSIVLVVNLTRTRSRICIKINLGRCNIHSCWAV
uniref:DUF4134 domain-containing protein n=1 Tax=Meloidogyne hapla TaxID=6305 RepID=A0A1I8BHB7_MELHA